MRRGSWIGWGASVVMAAGCLVGAAGSAAAAVPADCVVSAFSLGATATCSRTDYYQLVLTCGTADTMSSGGGGTTQVGGSFTRRGEQTIVFCTGNGAAPPVLGFDILTQIYQP